jgi:hypothetical protein
MEQRQNQLRRYGTLGIVLAVDLVAVFLLMHTVLASFDHLHFNWHSAYMSLMLTAPLAIVMLIAMRSSYRSPPMNIVIGAAAATISVVSFIVIHTHAGVDDEELLRSMIPRHSVSILMCREATITDPEVVALCRSLVQSQEKEIALMQAILARY